MTREVGTAPPTREGTREQRPLQSEYHQNHQEHASQRATKTREPFRKQTAVRTSDHAKNREEVAAGLPPGAVKLLLLGTGGAYVGAASPLLCAAVGWSVVGWLVGLVWFGLVWFGLVWFGLVWFGLVDDGIDGERRFFVFFFPFRSLVLRFFFFSFFVCGLC